MSYPYSLIRTMVTGQTIVASQRNDEHRHHIDNKIPASIDDASSNIAAMQTTADPYPAGSPSQATTFAEELHRLRYVIKQISGESDWYGDPDSYLSALATSQTDWNSVTSALNDGDTPNATSADVNSRLDQIVSQLKLITGGANWYTAPASSISTLGTTRDSLMASGGTSDPNSVSYLKSNMQNILINGGFEMWPEGTSFSKPGTSYTAGLWKMETNATGSTNWNVTQETTNFDTGTAALKYARSGTAGTITSLRVVQYVENISHLKAKDVKFSVRVRSNTTASAFLGDNTGVVATSTAHTGDDTWQTLSVGVTVGTAISDFRVGVNVGTASTAVTYIDSAMLAYGTAIPTFTPADLGVDTKRYERYHETGAVAGTGRRFSGRGYSDGTNYLIQCPIRFRAFKRNTPSVTLTALTVEEDGSGVDNKASYTVTAPDITQDGFSVKASKTIAGSRPASISFYWVADSRI